MSYPESEMFESFRVARRIGVRDRDGFEGLRGVSLLADTLGVSMSSHAGMVSVDLLTPHEGAAITARYPEFTEESVVNALKVSRRRKESLTDYIDVAVEKAVEAYEEVPGGLLLGVPLEPAAQARMSSDRDDLAELLSGVLDRGIVLPPREPYVKVGFIHDGNIDDSTLGLLADTAESTIWPGGGPPEQEPSSLFLFDPEVYPVSLPVGSKLPDIFKQ